MQRRRRRISRNFDSIRHTHLSSLCLSGSNDWTRTATICHTIETYRLGNGIHWQWQHVANKSSGPRSCHLQWIYNTHYIWLNIRIHAGITSRETNWVIPIQTADGNHAIQNWCHTLQSMLTEMTLHLQSIAGSDPRKNQDRARNWKCCTFQIY